MRGVLLQFGSGTGGYRKCDPRKKTVFFFSASGIEVEPAKFRKLRYAALTMRRPVEQTAACISRTGAAKEAI